DRGLRSEEPRVDEREDAEEDNPCRCEGEEGDHEPSSFQPPLDPPEKSRIDSWKDQKDDDGGEEREQLGSLPQGPDEERFDCPGDSPHGEVDRDLGEEQSEAERAQNEGDDERAASLSRSSGKAVAWIAAEECRARLQRG